MDDTLEQPLSMRYSCCPQPLATKDLMQEDVQTVVVFVGLPARGKTYTAKKLSRYLNWIGLQTKSFNVGTYRRDLTSGYTCFNFFDKSNEEATRLRLQAAKSAFRDLTSWLRSSGEIAVFDATNTTKERRRWIAKKCAKQRFNLLFIELICDDVAIIEQNILEVKVNSPDYQEVDKELAYKDFKNRLQKYEEIYETIDASSESTLSFIKVINQGTTYIAQHLHSNLHTRIAYFIMNMKILKKNIYITRQGETEADVNGIFTTNTELSDNGIQYSKCLAEYFDNLQLSKSLKVWTSHKKTALRTASFLNVTKKNHWKLLDEINMGEWDGLTYKEMLKRDPDLFRMRDENKFHFRFPGGGESYEDLVARLEPLIMELEHFENILIVTHEAVARCLLAYFQDIDYESLPYIKVPLHTLIKLTPTAYGCDMKEVNFDVPAVNNYREKPTEVRSITKNVLEKNRLNRLRRFSTCVDN